MTNSIVVSALLPGETPPVNTPLVAEAIPPVPLLFEAVASPKSVALPAVAMLTKSITLEKGHPA